MRGHISCVLLECHFIVVFPKLLPQGLGKVYGVAGDGEWTSRGP